MRQPAADGWWVVAVCVLLVLAILLAFGETLWHGFFNLDDHVFVHDEPHVVAGLSWSAVVWAFTTGPLADWCPLAMLSHMLDCQIYGLNSAGHHLTNVALHAASAVLLFLVLRRMTQQLWPSAMVAALFALHPLRVESVAWIAERRDVLSGFFFMLTLAAYVEYVRQGRSLARYLVVCAMLALGLLAKAMLITVPALLLLVDFWPLGRLGQAERSGAPPPAGPRQSFWRLVYEKLPLFALALGAAVAALGSHPNPALKPLLSLTDRLSNAVVSCVAYLGQLLVPIELSIFYPYPETGWPAWQVAAAALLLAGISAAAVVYRRSCPYLFVGWFWYLGMLVPVLELIPVGAHARADRYTYLPQIGLDLALVWGAMRLGAAWPARRWVFGIGSAVLLVALMICTWRQTSLWRDSKTVWEHALACDEKNVTAHYNLGLLWKIEDERVAVAQFQLALRRDPAERGFYDPPRAGSHVELGHLAEHKGDVAAAIAHYKQALELQPGSGSAHAKLALALSQMGNYDEAMPHFQRSIELEPERVVMYNNRAMALVRQGKFDEALADFRQAEKLDPDSLPVQVNLASCLADAGKFDEAIVHFRRAIEIDPDAVVLYQQVALLLRRQEQDQQAAEWDERALAAGRRLARTENRRGSELAKQGKIDEALARFQAAIAADAGFATPHDNLADALASRGRIREALEHYRRALEIDPADARAKSGLARWPDLEFGAASGR